MKERASKGDREASGLIAWFTDNHVAANILMGFLLVGGLFGVLNMRSETFPAIDPQLITVTVPYPGATPYEVDESITGRIEEALLGIEGVKRITATASEGLGVVRVEIKDFADGDQVYNDVETAVNGLASFPPEDAERPIVSRARVTPSVMTLALFGDVPETTLRHWAETLEDQLQLIDGVSLTSIRGIREFEISIEVSERKLREHGLAFTDVSQRVAEFSSDVPAGNIESREGEILLRVQEQNYFKESFEAVPLLTKSDGSQVLLRDVAEVSDGLADGNLISRFNGKPAAFIDINRSESQDTLKIAKSIKDYLDEVSLPAGLELAVQQDETTVLEDRISLMLRNAIIGFALVFIILLLFLDLKLAVWTSAAIPVSFLGGMLILYLLGYSLNMISLFALIVVLGIVVDDGVVTGEAIFEEQEKSRNDPHAALRGVRSIIAPVTVGVTTTMAAFAPLLFSTGTLGQIVGVIPAVVIPILLISLIDAYFILPAHLSHPGRWSVGIIGSIRRQVTRGLEAFVEKCLLPVTTFCLRWRYLTITGFFAIAILTASLVQSGIVRFVFFPQIESDQIRINLKMPVGTPFVETEATISEIERAVTRLTGSITGDNNDSRGIIESVSTSIGSTSPAAGPGRSGSGETGGNVGELTLQLVPSDFRNVTAAEIEARLRDEVGNLPGIDELTFESSLAGNEADIEIDLAHPDEAQLIAAARELRDELTKLPGAINVSSTFEEGKQEYLYRLNAEGLAVGLSPAELGRQLRAGFFGLEVQRVQRGPSEVIVYVRYPKAERESVATLDRMRIRLPDGRSLPLSAVADREVSTGFSEINSVDGRRVVTLTADADLAVTTPNAIISQLEEEVLPRLREDFPTLTDAFAGETRDQRQDLLSLGRNMLIALLIIYVILGGQLRSYLQPFVIMTAIPFGVIGAILGHFLLGYDLTFISLFGVVALTGVVVNDSVVLMDYFNNQFAETNDFDASIRAAVARRFRPILLTTLSTCLGLLPMLLETSVQAQFLIPMVVSLATGIVFATPVILILVPCLLALTVRVNP